MWVQKRTVTFSRSSFTFKFLLADVARPIIGFDFLWFHKLDVSPAASLVQFAATGTLREPPAPSQSIIASAANPLAKVSPVVLAAIPADVQALLAEFPAILRGVDEPPAPTHGVEHHIETTGRPIFPKLAGWTAKSWPLHKLNFSNWKKQV